MSSQARGQVYPPFISRLASIMPRALLPVTKRTVLALGILVFGGLAGHGAIAGTCDLHPVPGHKKPLPRSGAFDQALASQAILEEVNRARCLHGLGRLKDDAGIVQVSFDHSKWMARNAELSHTSRDPGRQSLKQRLQASAYPFRTGAENVAYVPLFNIRDQQVYIEGDCLFRSTAGDIVEIHSYGTLAAYLVQNWMESPGHRANILKQGITTAGAGVSLDADSGLCGHVYATHIFAG